MVYYFTSNVTTPPATIYVGKDKFENEELIKYGWEEDVWYPPTPTQLLPQTHHTPANRLLTQGTQLAGDPPPPPPSQFSRSIQRDRNGDRE
ncbi:hypothetical protein MMC08_002162 [Hypocenomyce scalaris]|nr:hypothetical protein [Hypocenomyce scalaris]